MTTSGSSRAAGVLVRVAIVMAAAACGHGAAGTRATFEGRSGNMTIDIIEKAAGATRLLRSPSGRYLAAELAGDWMREEFRDNVDEIPPVILLFDTRTGERVATANGWALGPPTDAGDLVYIEEHGSEYDYRVRSLARPEHRASLDPPDGYFVVRGAERAGDHLVAVLWAAPEPGGDAAGERLWLASIDPASLETVATATRTARMPLRWDFRRLNAGVAASASPSRLYLLEYPVEEKTWHLTALDAATLDERWRAPFEGTSEYPGVEASGVNALVTATGDGAHVAVVYGSDRGGRVVPELVHVFAATTGKPVRSMPMPLDARDDAIHAVPAPGRNAIVLLHVAATRHDPERFTGVTVLDLDDGAILDQFDVSRASVGDRLADVYDLRPGALTCTQDLTVVVAPRGDPADPARGRDSSEVAGLVRTPADWHREGRPRVDARTATLGRPVPE